MINFLQGIFPTQESNPSLLPCRQDLPTEPPGKPKNTGVGSLPLSPGDLPNPEIKPGSPALQVDSLPAEPPGKPLPGPRHYFEEKAMLHEYFYLYLSKMQILQNTKTDCYLPMKNETFLKIKHRICVQIFWIGS